MARDGRSRAYHISNSCGENLSSKDPLKKPSCPFSRREQPKMEHVCIHPAAFTVRPSSLRLSQRVFITPRGGSRSLMPPLSSTSAGILPPAPDAAAACDMPKKELGMAGCNSGSCDSMVSTASNHSQCVSKPCCTQPGLNSPLSIAEEGFWSDFCSKPLSVGALEAPGGP